MTDETERRDILRTGGALLSTAAVGGLSGCLGGSTDGDDGDGGGGDGAGNEPFPLESWLYAPGTIGSRSQYSFQHRSYAAISRSRGELSGETSAGLETEFRAHPIVGLSGVSMGDVSHYLSLGPRNQEVLYADFDADAVASGLIEDVGFEAAGQHAGFDLYSIELPSQDVSIAVGLSDKVMLRVEDAEAVTGLERFAATPSGETTRYADADEHMAELLSHLDPGDWTEGEIGAPTAETDLENNQLAGQVGFGIGMTFGGEQLDVTYVVAFESEADLDLGVIDDWVAANEEPNERFEPTYDVTVEGAGRSAIVTATRDTASL